MPPKYEAQASSRAPVIVTFASKAASTPRFIISKSSSVSRKAAMDARAIAFAAALLLLSPLAAGMLDQVFIFAPKLLSKQNFCRTLDTVFSARTVLSFGSEVISVLKT